MGDYRFADQPSDPVVLHLSKVPLDGRSGDVGPRAGAGRAGVRSSTLTFEEMEREIREMLGAALGPAGFDPATDIEGITVNRWSHGYALEYMRPWDEFWPDGPLPIEVSRTGYGRVAIANSDAGAYAYVHSAIDQAGRAVAELLGDRQLPGVGRLPRPAARRHRSRYASAIGA